VAFAPLSLLVWSVATAVATMVVCRQGIFVVLMAAASTTVCRATVGGPGTSCMSPTLVVRLINRTERSLGRFIVAVAIVVAAAVATTIVVVQVALGLGHAKGDSVSKVWWWGGSSSAAASTRQELRLPTPTQAQLNEAHSLRCSQDNRPNLHASEDDGLVDAKSPFMHTLKLFGLDGCRGHTPTSHFLQPIIDKNVAQKTPDAFSKSVISVIGIK
jgi:hypothetical protein